ncbi:MAG: ComF family protein [Cyanobacteria bacterium J06639_1]
MAWFDWLLPPSCPLCQRKASGNSCCFCRECAANFPPPGKTLWSPANDETSLPVYAWGAYDGALRRSLQLLKYHQQPRIGETFGHWLGQYWRQTHTAKQKHLVIPIPLHRDRQQQRGYNQAEQVSRAFCRVTGDRHAPDILQRVKVTEAQFGLSRSDRFRNLQRAFAVSPQLDSRYPVLLVDDIYTTGATMAAAIDAMRRVRPNVKVVGAIAIARALSRNSQ